MTEVKRSLHMDLDKLDLGSIVSIPKVGSTQMLPNVGPWIFPKRCSIHIKLDTYFPLGKRLK